MSNRYRCAAYLAAFIAVIGGLESFAKAQYVGSVNAGTITTIETTGPYTPSGQYVQVNGSNTTFPAYDPVQFNSTSFQNNIATINTATLTLTENPLRTLTTGPVNFYLTEDTTTAISALRYSGAANSTGGYDGSNATIFNVGSLNFRNAAGTDSLTLTLSAAANAYLTNQIDTGGAIRFIATAGGGSNSLAQYSSVLSTSTLSIAAQAPLRLTWGPTGGSNVWDTTTANFRYFNGGGFTQSVFHSQDNVSFTGNSPTTVAIQTAGVSPTSTNVGVFGSSTPDYTFTGGPVTAGSLSVIGNTLNLNNAPNTYSGLTLVNQGTLITANDQELPNGDVEVDDGTLELNNHSQTLHSLNLLNTSYVDTGSGTLTVPNISSDYENSIISGHLATAGGTVTFTSPSYLQPIVNASISGSGTLAFNGGNTILNGSNGSFTGNIVVNNGGLQFGGADSLGAAGGTLFLNNAGLYAPYGDTGTVLPLNAVVDGVAEFERNNIEFNLADGSISCYQGRAATLYVDNTTTFTTPLKDYAPTQPTGFTLTGVGTLVLNSSSNSFAGSINIAGGNLRVNAGSSITSASGVTLVSADRVTSTMTLLGVDQLNHASTLAIQQADTGTVTLALSGANTVNELIFNGLAEPAGIYTASNEPPDDLKLISSDSTGSLTVLSTPEPACALGMIAFPPLLRRRRTLICVQ